MVITHSVIKNPGEKGYASEWNAEHIFDDENRALRGSSFIVAASDSRDKERADYVCDGVADEVEINTAIDELPDTGGGIQLLEGTYDIDSKIIIDKDNVLIMGLGRATKIQTNNNIYMIHANNKTGVLIGNLRLYGAGAGNGSNIGIVLETVTESFIDKCWIEHCGGLGLFFDTCNTITVSNCKIFNITNFGIQTTDCTECAFLGCSIHSNDASGILIDAGERNIVANNLVYENEQMGIYISFSNNNIITDNVVRDNDYSNLALFDGIRLSAADRNIVANNRCMNNDRYEIRINTATCDRNLIHGNIAEGTDHVETISDAGTNTLLADNVTL